MELTAHEIASVVGGEVIGNPDVKVNNISKIDESTPGTLTFLANPKYNTFLYETKASIVLLNQSFDLKRKIKPTIIRVPDAYESFSVLMDLYIKSIPVKKGIETPSFVSPSVKFGEGTYIGAFAYIDEGVTIGRNVQIYPNCWIGRNSVIKDNTILFSGVKIYPESRIGENCIIHSGVVIGSDGFGFVPKEDGTYKKLQQYGNVIIEDDVEIGVNTTIDCATIGSTIIRKGVKLDNLVQIAHNVEVGENTVMAAFVGISGSTKIGHNCVFAGQSGAAGHLKIGNNVTLGGKTGASNHIANDKTMMGEWAMDAAKFRRVYAVYRKLPELYRELNKLKKEIKQKLTFNN